MSQLFQPPLHTSFIDPMSQNISHPWQEWLRLVGVTLSAGTDLTGVSGAFASFDITGALQNSGYSVDDTQTDTSHLWTSSKINTAVAGAGDVDGPASSTDNAVVRFDLATGKLIQNSGVTIDDSNNVDANSYKVSGTQVIGSQQAAEANAAAPTNYTAHAAGAVPVTSNAATDLDTTAAALATLEDEVTALTNKVNSLLAKLRTHGIIAT